MKLRKSLVGAICAGLIIIAGALANASGDSTELNAAERLKYASRFDDGNDNKTEPREPAEVWHGLETAGWPDALSAFQARFHAGKSYLTLYKKLPRWPMDMRSPDRFKRSMSSKEIANKSSIGHMAIGWSCAPNASPESRVEGFAAQTGEDGQQPEMLSNGWGVTSLVSTFTDGRLQNGEEIQRYFASSYVEHLEGGTSDGFSALVIEVPSNDCTQVREFVKNYVFHPSVPYRNFGMMLDPLKFEGAGCGSFAVSALSMAPSLAPLMSQMWRTVPIAEKLLGRRTRVNLPNDVVPAVYAKIASEEYHISKYRLVLMNWDSGKIAMKMRAVDPELMIFSFRKLSEIATSRQPLTTRYQIENLELLKRHFNFSATSNDTNFDDKDSGYQEIDAAFDPNFNGVSSAVNQWWSAREASSQANLISFPFGVGVMIESRTAN